MLRITIKDVCNKYGSFQADYNKCKEYVEQKNSCKAMESYFKLVGALKIIAQIEKMTVNEVFILGTEVNRLILS